MTQNKRNIIYCLTALLITIFVLRAVYSTIDKSGGAALSPGKVVEQFRDIETTGKKWLNGHFGVFFRFKYLGNINWLSIPLLVYFFIRVKKRERWQMALVFVWLLTALLIGIKGFDNYRYQFTLFPFTVTMVLLLLWKFLKGEKKYLKILCFSFFTLICLYNVYHYLEVYSFLWDLRVSGKSPHFPYHLVDYINTSKDIKKQSKVYVINKPLFYYHTNKKGIDSRGNNAMKVNLLFKSNDERNRQKAFYLLKNRLKTTYILVKSSDKKMYRTRMLTEFLQCECRLVLKDKGWFLYMLRDRSLEDILRSHDLKKIKIWFPRKKLLRNISPSLHTFFHKGEFEFDCDMKERVKRNVLTIYSTSPDIDGERTINFGYEANRKGIKMGIPEGKYVHFIVKAKISPNLMNRDNYLFISDFKESWEGQKVFFSTPGWRTYLISKKVRFGCSRLVLGVRFSPESTEDRLMIKEIQVAISKKNLE